VAESLKIMVVDDHAAFRSVVRAMLGIDGWDFIECQDGQEAVDRYPATRPDLVLMDIAMAGLDGLRATAQIKRRFPAARILILTEHDDPLFRAAAQQAGACGFLPKENLLGLENAVRGQTWTIAAMPQPEGERASGRTARL
jgi:CheY-like chemotaxis protein